MVEDALAVGTNVLPAVLRDYPDVVGTVTNTSESVVSEPVSKIEKATDIPVQAETAVQAEIKDELNVNDPGEQLFQIDTDASSIGPMPEIDEQVPEIQFSLESTTGNISLVYDQINQGLEKIMDINRPIIKELEQQLVKETWNTPFSNAVSERIEAIQGLEYAFKKACGERFETATNNLSLLVQAEVEKIASEKYRMLSDPDRVTELVETSVKAIFVPETKTSLGIEDDFTMTFKTIMKK